MYVFKLIKERRVNLFHLWNTSLHSQLLIQSAYPISTTTLQNYIASYLTRPTPVHNQPPHS